MKFATATTTSLAERSCAAWWKYLATMPYDRGAMVPRVLTDASLNAVRKPAMVALVGGRSLGSNGVAMQIGSGACCSPWGLAESVSSRRPCWMRLRLLWRSSLRWAPR